MGNWLWNAQIAKQMNGDASPRDYELPAHDIGDGHAIPYWKRHALLPNDTRSLPSYLWHTTPAERWKHYFCGSTAHPDACERLDALIAEGKYIIMLGANAGKLTVEQVLQQVPPWFIYHEPETLPGIQ